MDPPQIMLATSVYDRLKGGGGIGKKGDGGTTETCRDDALMLGRALVFTFPSEDGTGEGGNALLPEEAVFAKL